MIHATRTLCLLSLLLLISARDVMCVAEIDDARLVRAEVLNALERFRELNDDTINRFRYPSFTRDTVQNYEDHTLYIVSGILSW